MPFSELGLRMLVFSNTTTSDIVHKGPLVTERFQERFKWAADASLRKSSLV